VRGRRPEDLERDHGVDLEHRAKLVVAHPVGDPVPAVAGVVDDDVELPEGLDRRGHERVADAVPGEVAREHRGGAVDRGGGLLRRRLVQVGDHHARAVLGE